MESRFAKIENKTKKVNQSISACIARCFGEVEYDEVLREIDYKTDNMK